LFPAERAVPKKYIGQFAPRLRHITQFAGILHPADAAGAGTDPIPGGLCGGNW